MTVASPDISPVAVRPLSVIIPVYRDDAALAILLQRLAPMGIAALYIIDGDGRAETPAAMLPLLSQLHHVIWRSAPRGRGPQIAQGLDLAMANKTTEAIWILHADSAPHSRSVRDIFQILSRPQTALGMFRLDFGRPHWAYHLFSFFARFDSALTSFGDQGFFFRRRDVAALWPWLKDDLLAAPILDDVVLRRALRSRGGVKKSRLALATSPRRFERYGLWRTQTRNMLILLRARLGASPHQLYDSYYNPAPPALLKRDAPKAPPIVVLGP